MKTPLGVLAIAVLVVGCGGSAFDSGVSLAGGAAGTGGAVAGGSAGPTAIGGSAGVAGVTAIGGSAGVAGVTAIGGSAGVAGSTDPDRCAFSKDSGMCDAYVPSFWFNAKTGLCESFIYGGCGGNANRFDSMQACYDACGWSAQPDYSKCLAPSDCV
jgi:Kunitz/Bovine pancreatic trypsin inhibitor domain